MSNVNEEVEFTEEEMEAAIAAIDTDGDGVPDIDEVDDDGYDIKELDE